MITTVTLNPAVDKTLVTNTITIGGLNRVLETLQHPGGKGINVSKALAALGTQTIALGIVGGHTGRWIEQYLRENNIPSDFVQGYGETRTNIKVFEQRTEKLTEFNETGVLVPQEVMERVFDKIKEYADQSEYMVFSGSIPEGLRSDIYYTLISSLKGKVKTVLDADGILLANGIEASPSIVKPNIDELRKLFGRNIEGEADILACGEALLDKGIEKVLVSMGAEGSMLVTKDACYKALPLKIEVKSTVGAGDSMVAGFLHGLDGGMKDVEALRFAAACGTAAVMSAGTGVFSWADVERILPRVNVIKIQL